MFPIDRTATISVEVGIDGLSNLDTICIGFAGFITKAIQDEFGAGAASTVTCSRGRGRRHLQDNNTTSVLDDQKPPDMVTNQLDYEKPVLITVATTFPNWKTAPRQFGFLEFLEQLVVSDRAMSELPLYIQRALGTNSDIGAVYVTLLQQPQARQKAVLLVAFGDAPTAMPSLSPTFVNMTDNSTTLAPISPSGTTGVQYLGSLLVSTLVGGILLI